MARARAPRALDLGAVHVRPIRPPSKRAPEWYWRAVRYVEGREETVWTGRASREEAERTVAALVAGGDLGRREKPAEVRTLRDLLECWVGAQERRQDLAAATFVNYRRAASSVAERIGAVEIGATHKGTLERYRDQRLGEDCAPSSLRVEYQVLRSAWRWGQDMGLCPARRLDVPKVNGGRVTNGRTPTRGDVAKVLADLQARGSWAYLATLLLLATGARVGEVTHLRWADVDLAEGWLFLGRHDGARKTGEREVPFEAEVRRALEAAGPGRPGDLVLGQEPMHARSTLGLILKRACKRAGVQPFVPGGLRRLSEDEMYRAHRDPSVAAALLGHSEQTALRFYRKATRADLRAAVREVALGKVPAGEVVAFPVASGD